MSGYSYSELQNMQQKAMERVREMKRNSDAVVQTAQKELDMPEHKEKTMQNNNFVSAKVTNMPPNFPQDNPYPSFKEFFNEQQEKNPQKAVAQAVSNAQTNNKNPIESLFAEPDKALLLGLIMLLKSEGADESLIMALTYIMS